MTEKETSSGQAADLRKRAVEIALEAAELSPENIDGQTPAEIRQAFHELRVHQIELDMQNDELRRAHAELDAVLARYIDLYDLAPVGYLTVSAQGLILEANLTAATLLGVTRKGLFKQPMSRFIFKEDQDIYYLHSSQLFETGGRQACELRMVKKDKTTFWAHLNGTYAQDDQNEPVCRITINDISIHKQVEEKLSVSESKYRMLFESANDAILLMDQSIFVDCNPKALEMYGCTREQIIDQPFFRFSPEVQTDGRNSMEKAMEKINRALKGQSQFFEWKNSRYDGTLFDAEVSLNTCLATNKYYIQAIVRDITDRKRIEDLMLDSEKKYRELSIIDGLTNLYNSRYFYQQLKLEVDRVNRYEQQTMTLLLLDIDNFKQFNDAYGHVEGDQVLLRLGQVVKRCLRQTDSAYRYGGEEFTLLLPMTTCKDAAATAERVRTEFKKETFSPAPGQGDVYMTISIGLGQYKPQEDMKAFVRRVDQLMYLAKKSGKDRVCSEEL